ncbi:hypothetical protein [Microtetraspora sp. NBRC 16547]|uniref:hypothetical protein n=1 Tax=Microtetraspora sp. NBRC 16547 TaxID=3030993 RepID=UPI0024A15561|nr:hypothetical protein [Microtetraspora sp. NBRC 16547]GLX02940.1 hypothetical protein Misp02_70260 [Microtetraspora sp. NBRC 16547]
MVDPDYDMVAARILRRMRPEAAQAFLDSPEWRETPEGLRERIYVADARWEEIERRARLDTSQAGRDETPATQADPEPEPGECEGCGAPLQRAGTGRPARYCSQACRQRAYRARKAPETAIAAPSTAPIAPDHPAYRLAGDVAQAVRRAADAISLGLGAGAALDQARAALTDLARLADEAVPRRDETTVTKPKKDRDPIYRRRWYTDEEIAAVQLVRVGEDSPAYWVVIAGERLGTVAPHRSVTGGRSGWEARHRGGSPAWHLGTGTRPATRQAAVTDLISAVHHAWRNMREQQQRDHRLKRAEQRDQRS